MKGLIVIGITTLFLTGCAGNEYKEYAQTQREIAQSKSYAESSRYEALAKIAESGDESSKVAAAMALALSGNQKQAQTHVAAPKSWADTALDWARVLVPTLGNTVSNAYTIKESNRTARHTSDNNTSVQINTNETMGDIADMITVPEPTVVTTEKVVEVTNQEVVTVNPVIVEKEVVVEPVIVDPEVITIDPYVVE